MAQLANLELINGSQYRHAEPVISFILNQNMVSADESEESVLESYRDGYLEAAFEIVNREFVRQQFMTVLWSSRSN